MTLPQDVRIEHGRLRFPKIGWMRLSRRGGDPYADARPVSVTVKRVCGKWYATVCYAVEAVARLDDDALLPFARRRRSAVRCFGRSTHGRHRTHPREPGASRGVAGARVGPVRRGGAAGAVGRRKRFETVTLADWLGLDLDAQ